MLKKVFTTYSILGCILAAALPLSGFLIQLPGLGMAGVLGIPILAGWFWAVKAPLPDTLFARLMPLVLPPLLLALLYILHALGIITGIDLPVSLALAGPSWCGFYFGFLLASEWRRGSTARIRGIACLLGVMLPFAGGVAVIHHIGARDILELRTPGEVSVGQDVRTGHYRPFRENNRLAEPASSPTLHIASDYPRLVGTSAIFPLYAAFAQAVYEGLDEQSAREVVVNRANAVEAYWRLIDGEADIFFGAAPSQKQRDYAASRGLPLGETLLGKEALVFFVHKDNPVRSLTQAQIKAVYSGRIHNWKELGGPGQPILAFQRPDDSDSQAAMSRIMEGEPLARPPREKQTRGRYNTVVIDLAEYRNRENALGYSFLWSVTGDYANPDVRLLAIDGTLPTPENIRSGDYPFTVPLLAVTARPLSPQSENLLEWITGPEGQDLLERAGYVPLR